MVERSRIKNLIYQYIRNHPLVISWFVVNYPNDSIADHLFEAGSPIPTEVMKFPAIRYRVNFLYEDSNCTDILSFDVMADSRSEEGSIESDELMDLIRKIFLEDEGRALGAYSTSSDYQSIVSGDSGVQTWKLEEIYQDQITSTNTRDKVTRERIEAYSGTIFSVQRFQGNVAEI